MTALRRDHGEGAYSRFAVLLFAVAVVATLLQGGGATPASLWTVPEAHRVQVADLLLSEANGTRLEQILSDMPLLEPGMGGTNLKDDELTWVPGQAPLYGSGGPRVDDVDQGNLGDCWFLAALAAVAQQDPDFIREHIRRNLNGTYTVTLYQDGRPIDVTVTARFPSQNGFGPSYAQTPDGRSSWVAIYEKALAQLMGGYGAIEGGDGEKAFGYLTGGGNSGHPGGWFSGVGKVSLNDIAISLKKGNALVTGTVGAPRRPGVLKDHEYTVVRVNRDAHPSTITLRNPWGAQGPTSRTPEYITLTEDQWHANFDELGWVHP